MTTTSLPDLLRQSPYQSYTYAYPHKTAYRPLPSPLPLTQVWQTEPQEALFLYVHIPFCEIRCGFCNLFTTTHPGRSLEASYLDTLQRQAHQTRLAVPQAQIAQLAIGGGTPTYLNPADLAHLLNFLEQTFAFSIAHLPASIETSPATATPEKIALLKERGFSRVSIGIQSFIPAELQHIGRPQNSQEVYQSLERLQKAQFPTLNLDLIYGCPGQTVESWLYSLTEALRFEPEELYLYPLYVRPLTGMDKMAQSWDDQRQELYQTGREFLLAHGYEQRSMRFFRRVNHTAQPTSSYCCQEDGMIGLGCGARSYTRTLHYATEYAVGRPGVKAILQEWINRPDSAFAQVDYGFVLDPEEQKRRYLLKSLLNTTGLDGQAYTHFFDSAPEDDFPALAELLAYRLAEQTAGRWQLTPAGLAWSDAIGPWFYSPAVLHQMNLYQLQ